MIPFRICREIPSILEHSVVLRHPVPQSLNHIRHPDTLTAEVAGDA